jgi:Tfp pilus assembly protein PilN
MSDNTLNSEQKLLLLTWREKSRHLDRLTEQRMKFLLLAVGLILVGYILYCALRAKASFDPNQQPAAMYEYSSTPLV